MRSLPLIATVVATLTSSALGLQPVFDFDNGARGWRTNLDGVMGGLSTGRITQPESGTVRFAGELSLENNGGFSQMRTVVDAGSFAGTQGVQLRVKGDGRTYQFNVGTTDARVRAGGFQADFETRRGEWVTQTIPFSQFELYNFGRRVAGAPSVSPANIEWIGITIADKTAGPFAIEVDSIRGVAAATDRPAPLAQLAQSAGLTTLLALLQAAELDLPKDRELTIFAPTNDAFAAIPADKVEFLTSAEGRPLLRSILRHHVVSGETGSAELLQRRSVTALSGQRLAIDAEKLAVSGAPLITTDVPFDGGVVHVIGAVMMPQTLDIPAVIAGDERLSMLGKALASAGLTANLQGAESGPFTVFAPTNSAFAGLSEQTLAAVASDPATLARILGGHVVSGRVLRAELLAKGSLPTLSGTTIRFGVTSGAITAAGSRILEADIPAANGVVHIIDTVIVPAASDAPEARDTRGRARLLIERAIERGVPLFNGGNAAACAAVYEVAIVALIDLAPGVLGDATRQRLESALAEGVNHATATDRAWAFRRGLDATLIELAR